MFVPMLRERWWFGSLISRCQILAGEIADRASPGTLIAELRRLTTALPEVLSLPEELLVRGLLSRLLGRLIPLAHLDSHPRVMRAFMAWETSRSSSSTLRQEWSSLVECCVEAMNELEYDKGMPERTLDTCLRRVLSDIQANYQDSALRLSTVAKHANLSPWYLARILKRRTGLGFVEHLRRVRVSAARQLLVQTPLSIKEIAAAVGYAHPNQLGRHFIRTLGMTPSSFRRGVS
jgi:AraC-like DNA-binding protein